MSRRSRSRQRSLCRNLKLHSHSNTAGDSHINTAGQQPTSRSRIETQQGTAHLKSRNASTTF